MAGMNSEYTTTGWSYITLGIDRVPVHCGRQALDLDLGEWECSQCDAVTHVREIPNWQTMHPHPNS